MIFFSRFYLNLQAESDFQKSDFQYFFIEDERTSTFHFGTSQKTTPENSITNNHNTKKNYEIS